MEMRMGSEQIREMDGALKKTQERMDRPVVMV